MSNMAKVYELWTKLSDAGEFGMPARLDPSDELSYMLAQGWITQADDGPDYFEMTEKGAEDLFGIKVLP